MKNAPKCAPRAPSWIREREKQGREGEMEEEGRKRREGRWNDDPNGKILRTQLVVMATAFSELSD